MNLKSFSVGNFKAFGQPVQKFPIKPITLVFGPNSAGKSSLLHSLLWLNHAVRRDELDVRFPVAAKGSIDLGGFSQIVNDQATPARVVVELELEANSISPALRKELSITEALSVQMSYGHSNWAGLQSEISLLDFSIQIDGDDIIRAVRQKQKLKIIHFDVKRFRLNDNAESDSLSVPANKKVLDALEMMHDLNEEERREVAEVLIQQYFEEASLVGPAWMPDAVLYDANKEGVFSWVSQDSLFQSLLRTIHDALKRDLSKFTYVPPLRDIPARYFDATGADEVWAKLFEEPILLDKVNQWLGHSVFKTKYQIHVSEYFSRSVLDEKLPQFIRSEILMATLPDENPNNENSISVELVEVLEQLKDSYESSNPETILESYPELKEELLDIEADNYWQDNMRDIDPGEHATLEEVRRWSDGQADLDCWVGIEALKHHGFYATTLFTKWAADQPQVLNVFNSGDWSDAEETAKEFLSLLAASKRDVRREIHLKDKDKGTTVSLQDVGVGVSQVLPVIINAFGRQNEFIAIEQPEIHIHPALQAELGDLFIESALGQNKNTFLLETHSEHLILRLLRRIRETTEGDMESWPDNLRKACPNGIRPHDVAVIYIQPGTEGAQAKHLRINELGEFVDEWPGGFFDERSREIF